MEGSSGGNYFPPPQPATFQSPYIGESGKVRSALDLLNITKILALIMGIVGFLVALWDGIVFIQYGGSFVVVGVIYWIITGIVNLILFTRIPQYDAMIRARRYGEAKDDMIVWGVLTLIFGVIAGILLLLVVFLYLEELINMYSYGQQASYPQYPQQPQYPQAQHPQQPQQSPPQQQPPQYPPPPPPPSS